jgi:proteasome lid subunit RPN8/RPN11
VRLGRKISQRALLDRRVKKVRSEKSEGRSIQPGSVYFFILTSYFLGCLEDDGTRVVTSTARCGNTRTDSAHNRYNIDPQELVRIQREGRKRGEDIVGFYHSHPDHPAQWSKTDLAEAHWFGCSYVITSVEKGKAVLTNSFELMGSDETDKRLVDEPVKVD